MSISDICIKRPVFTWVLMAAPVVLGIVSYNSLGVDLFPNVDFPVASVTTVLPGASVEETETSVTKPIEDIINTVSGIEEMRSTTSEGISVVTVQFELSKSGDVGTQEVRDKVNSIMATLPEGTETPIIDKFQTDASPVLTIAVSGRRDLREVTEIARRQIKERLETVSGVGAISLLGGQTRAMNVVIDVDKLAAYNLSVDEVKVALVRQNLEVPGGRIDQGPRELVLRTLGRLYTSEQFDALIVSNRGGYPIRIRDIGRAENSFEEPRTLARLDGVGAVSLVVQKQSGTNTVKVVHEIKRRLEELRKALPSDIKTVVIKDQSRFIEKSIEEVKFHLLLAAGLVSATILLFIRDWRTTVIATLAIPTSIVPTFLFMQLMGFTLNNITMLGLILAIGIVIDDAVVVHENIFRHMEEDGMDAMEAARVGTREIALAVLATSFSLVVIFVPIAFMGGIIGRFFSSFGLTVAFAILMSLFVSFTLTPMLCSRFLKLEHAEGGHSSKSGFFYRIVDGAYGRLLLFSLRHKALIVLTAVVVLLAPAYGAIGSALEKNPKVPRPLVALLKTIGAPFAPGFALIPRDDQSEYEVSVITPEGYTMERTNAVLSDLESRLKKLPGSAHLFTTVGSSSGRAIKGQGDVTRGTIYVSMPELEERTYSQFDVQLQARALMSDFPDLRVSVNDVSAFQGGRRPQVFQVNLGGPELDQLEVYSERLLAELRKVPGIADLDTTLSLRKPEVRVAIDRERASDLGIPVASVADSLRILVGGQVVSTFRDGDQQYDVWLRARPGDRASTANINQLTIPSPTAGLVKLTSLAKLTEDRGPTEIERLGRQRIVTVLGNPDGMTLGDAVEKTRAILEKMDMPPQYTYEFSGQAKTLGETAYYFIIAFVLSVLFMYLILAAQFESWIQPISILMALPVTVPFGLLSLVMFRTPMDIYAIFGLFMLVGIVKKNGILQVDATNQLRDKGMPRHDAIVEANHVRLRPILMTTFMLVAAMVPIALGSGPGAGARASMAKVIIGGQIFSLILALLVTPVFYAMLDSMVAYLRGKGLRFSVAEGQGRKPTESPAQAAAPAHAGGNWPGA
ncbi:efflux RND transporter permease subunit [Isosphaeraceae bacterium EP7]